MYLEQLMVDVKYVDSYSWSLTFLFGKILLKNATIYNKLIRPSIIFFFYITCLNISLKKQVQGSASHDLDNTLLDNITDQYRCHI